MIVITLVMYRLVLRKTKIMLLFVITSLVITTLIIMITFMQSLMSPNDFKPCLIYERQFSKYKFGFNHYLSSDNDYRFDTILS